jgi:hypothetical protein
VGGAFWLPPGEWHLSLLTQLAIMPGLIARLGLRDMPRLLRLLSLIESKHPREAHFYLPVIGVAPEWQGKAWARRCCAWCWTAATATACPPTSRPPPSNRACYERNGFEVREELRVPGGGPPLRPMWREPARLGH